MTHSTVPQTSRSLDWLLILSLASLPLLQALFSITGWAEALGRPQTPLLITLAITVTWVLVVGFSRAPRPILTLLLASLIAAAVATMLSLLVPTLRTGNPGNLFDGFDVAATFLVTTALHAVWGTLAGLLGAGVQRLQGRRAHQA